MVGSCNLHAQSLYHNYLWRITSVGWPGPTRLRLFTISPLELLTEAVVSVFPGSHVHWVVVMYIGSIFSHKFTFQINFGQSVRKANVCKIVYSKHFSFLYYVKFWTWQKMYPKTIQKRLCFNNHFRILLPLKAKINKSRLNNFKILEVLFQV